MQTTHPQKKGVLLVNMGGPMNLSDMRLFLVNMFCDKRIMPLPWGIRHFVARMIAAKRYVSSWKKYELIGGSPILEHTEKAATALQERLLCPVKTAYSYTPPYIAHTIKELLSAGINDIRVVTMYPQNSLTTTRSVVDDVKKAIKRDKSIKVTLVDEYSDHLLFLDYWQNLIQTHLNSLAHRQPFLLFTAHSIPQYAVKNGDLYPETIKRLAANLAARLQLPYDVGFQSRVGPVKWVGPDTDELLKNLLRQGTRNVVIVPLSFTTECLETIYDLDLKLIGHYKNEKDLDLSRMHIPAAHPMFIELLAQISEIETFSTSN